MLLRFLTSVFLISTIWSTPVISAQPESTIILKMYLYDENGKDTLNSPMVGLTPGGEVEVTNDQGRLHFQLVELDNETAKFNVYLSEVVETRKLVSSNGHELSLPESITYGKNNEIAIGETKMIVFPNGWLFEVQNPKY